MLVQGTHLGLQETHVLYSRLRYHVAGGAGDSGSNGSLPSALQTHMDAWRRPAELPQGAQVPLVLLEERRTLRGTLFAGSPAVAWLVSEMQAVLAAVVRVRRALPCSTIWLFSGQCLCLLSSRADVGIWPLAGACMPSPWACSSPGLMRRVFACLCSCTELIHHYIASGAHPEGQPSVGADPLGGAVRWPSCGFIRRYQNCFTCTLPAPSTLMYVHVPSLSSTNTGSGVWWYHMALCCLLLL